MFRTRTRSLLLVSGLTALVLASCGKDTTVTASKASAPDSVPASAPATVPPSVSGTSQTFNGHGVTFQYPAGWQPILPEGESVSSGTQLWSETFGPDGANFVLVRQYRIPNPITTQNIDQHTGELTTQIQQLFVQAGGSMQAGPTKLSMAGFPALGYSGTAVNPQAVSVKSRIVLAYDNTTEYFVNCQSTGDTTAAIDAGCDQVISTFTVG